MKAKAKLNNRELAALLHSAASALEHGRYYSVRRKVSTVHRQLHPQLYNALDSDIYTDDRDHADRVELIRGYLREASNG